MAWLALFAIFIIFTAILLTVIVTVKGGWLMQFVVWCVVSAVALGLFWGLLDLFRGFVS